MNILIKITPILFFIFHCGISQNAKMNNNLFHLLVLSQKEATKSTQKKSDSGSGPNKPLNKNLTGVAQKGPFVKDSEVTITELNEDLTKTSKVYKTKTKDDLGSFEVNKDFTKRYILVSITGKYFNELKNEITKEPITLNSIVDIKEDAIVNLNLLTTFQKKRLEKLVQKGEKFEDAKQKSKEEILEIFDIDSGDIGESLNKLDIKESNELFRISLLVQSNRNVSDLKSLLENTEDDGKLKKTLIDELREEEKKLKSAGVYEKAKKNLEIKFNIKTKIDPSKLKKKEMRIYKKVSAGPHYSLALDEEGYLYSWGSNFAGKLGNGEDGTEKSVYTPTKIGNRKYKTISASTGGDHSFAIDEEGYLWGWGPNDFGQVGDGTRTELLVPTKIGSRKYKAVRANSSHSLALDKEGYLYSWGSNMFGQVGDGTKGDKSVRLVPTKVGNRKYKSIGKSRFDSFAIDKEDYLWAWGSNYGNSPVRIGKYKNANGYYGKDAAIGEDGFIYMWDSYKTKNPKKFNSDRKYKSIQVGGLNSSFYWIALGEDNYLYSWGDNYKGSLGDGSTTDRLVPTKIGNRKYKYMSSSGTHTLAVDEQGNIWTWGDNKYGILGTGQTTRLRTLTKIGDRKYKKINGGRHHSLALDENDNLWTWGRNDYGQLGDGTTTDRLVPTKTGDKNYKFISAGQHSSLALDENDNLWAWGKNDYGQLGDGTTTDRLVPTKIGNKKYKKISTGLHSSLALDENDNLWAWGRNDYGQLGNGTTTVHLVPIQIGDRKYKSIKTYHDRSLAIDEDGFLYSWGKNDEYHKDKTVLGVSLTHPSINKKDDGITYILVPTKIGDRKYKKIDISTNLSLGIGEDDFVYIWGRNSQKEVITPQKTGSIHLKILVMINMEVPYCHYS